MHKNAKALCAAALTLSLAFATGCTQPQQNPENTGPTASEYMITLNSTAAQLEAALSDFASTVEAGDVSAMQSKADAAYSIIDELNNAEAPEALSDVKSKYSDALSSLKGALGDYIDLYTEIDNAKSGSSFDFSTYKQRLEDIQKQYDDGLNALEEADKMVSEK